MTLMHAPLLTWIFRCLPRRQGAPSSTLIQSRVEVCPPELFPSSLSWRGRVRRLGDRLLRRATPWLPAQARPVNRLLLVRTEFLDALSDLDSPPVARLQDSIDRARSLRELWHLRSSVYGHVAMAFSQSEAERRLASLNRHFPMRAPRSGLMPLDA